MFKNIVKGIFTTVLGVGIISASIGTVSTGKATWTEAVVPLAIGIALIFTPDDLFKRINTFLKKDDTPSDSPKP